MELFAQGGVLALSNRFPWVAIEPTLFASISRSADAAAIKSKVVLIHRQGEAS